MTRARIPIPQERLEAFCKKHHIRKLSLFGSVLREDFRPDSDVDVLVVFEEDFIPGLMRLAGMEIELSEMLNRKVDLLTAGFLNPDYRDKVIAEAEVRYGSG